MPKTNEEIWAQDRLGRREEAARLEQFLRGEVAFLRSQGRKESFVLAIDAAYGEGKTFFLDRFRQQLALTHPVAFVDAWADDTGDEPLVAFMAAIEKALKPYLKHKAIKETFAQAKIAALPAIGKIMVGAGRKAVQKFTGEDTPDAIAELWEDVSGQDIDPDDIADVENQAFEKTEKFLSSLVDQRGATMLAEYRKRQKSRTAFRDRMQQVAEQLSSLDEGDRAPLFIIIDELDRCRPDYALKVLEEIKHFFQVPGVVFVIALHGDQLTKSVAAVYGQNFDSADYLQRFFSRTYPLRRLSLAELVTEHCRAAGFDDMNFNAPPLLDIASASWSEVAGQVLANTNLSPREALKCVDAIRIFAGQWEENIPIELPHLAITVSQQLMHAKGSKFVATQVPIFDVPITHVNQTRGTSLQPLVTAYHSPASTTFKEAFRRLREGRRHSTEPASEYVAQTLDKEMSARFGTQLRAAPEAPPLWSTYSERIQRIAWILNDPPGDPS